LRWGIPLRQIKACADTIFKTKAVKKPPKSFQPGSYFPNKDHPDYKKEELLFVIRNCLPHVPTQESTADLDTVFLDYCFRVYYYLTPIRRGWQKGPPGEDGESFLEQADRHVIRAIKKFGVDAFRLSQKDEEIVRGRRPSHSYVRRYLEIKDQLGAAVCAVIRYWQNRARTGGPKARLRSVKQLREVTRALIPETRGKRKSPTFDPGVVKAVYYKELFRLCHIRNALQTTPGTAGEKIKVGSQNFGMAEDQIREFWQLDETNQAKSRPLSVREIARILTARLFCITQHRVSNLLAS